LVGTFSDSGPIFALFFRDGIGEVDQKGSTSRFRGNIAKKGRIFSMTKTAVLIQRMLKTVTKTFYVLSMSALFFIASAIIYDVTLRAVFKKPTYWTVEVTSFMLVIITFLGASEILREDKHIRFSLVLDRLSPKARRIAEIINSLFGLAFCLALAWQGGIATHMVYVNDMRIPSIVATPLYIPYLFMSVGALVLSLQFILKILGHFFGDEKGESCGR
jgi:C4-dicarboxylate transporter DctQ subunit